MIKLNKQKSSSRISEAFQSINLRFAFVTKKNDKYSQITGEYKCRDFLGDCIWSKGTQNKVSIYGFNYSFAQTPYDSDCLRLSLQFPNKNSKDNFVANLHLLHKKEEQANTTKCVLLDTDTENCYILEADKVWQSNIWKISLYTFYIKIFSYKDILSLEDPEKKYFGDLSAKKEAIMLDKVTIEFNEHLYDELGTAHNYSGFHSVLTRKNKDTNKIIFGE